MALLMRKVIAFYHYFVSPLSYYKQAIKHDEPPEKNQEYIEPVKQLISAEVSYQKFNILDRYYEKIFNCEQFLASDLYDQYDAFHYTSFANALCILNEQTILASEARIKKFGFGVFMTKMCKPENRDDKIRFNNYNTKVDRHDAKLQCAFAFRKDSIKLNKIARIERDVWRFDGDLNLNKCDYILILRKHY